MNMYYTYKVKNEATRFNIDKILDGLFDSAVDETDIHIEKKRNSIYSDFSYERYRTIIIDSFPRKSEHINSLYQSLNQLDTLSLAIKSYLDRCPVTPGDDYKTFKIPKRSGGFREINAPNEDLMKFMREIQPWFAYKLNSLPHDSAYSYIHGRDCNKAIKRHQANNSNWFLKLDLSKFFDNCTPAFINIQLRQIYPYSMMSLTKYNMFIERLNALITKNNGLPQGTPLSPVITNLIMVPIDVMINKALHVFFKEEMFVYTRYADDLLVSCRKEFDPVTVQNIIKDVLYDLHCPFQINKEKTRYGSKAGSNWNLGIMYNKDNNLTVGYKRKKKLKTMLFQFYKMYNEGERDPEYAQVVLGELSYLQNIEPTYYIEFLRFLFRKYDFDFRQKLLEVIKN